MSAVLPVILAGGSGTRLWPLSRDHYPKQFLPLTSSRTMLQETLARLDGLDAAPPYLMCNEEHRFIVAEQCRAIGAPWSAIILEPASRNTAPAIALAALRALRDGDDPVLLVLAADHHIADPNAFRAAVVAGAAAACAGQLLTFGIVPRVPETGYGYIKAGAPRPGGVRGVAEFVEKPDLETAERYVAAGDYYWNSGMFMFKASAYVNELAHHRPDIHEACRLAAESMCSDLDFERPGAAFADSPSESIDYAVMEKTRHGVVLPIDVGWSDLGSWKALWETSPRDGHDNHIRGDVVSVDSSGSLLISEGRLLATVGVKDLMVVETADAVLVADRGRSQDVKRIVERLRSCNRPEHQTHQRVYRPWGSYETVEAGGRHQVKRITVKPGATLSLQMHHHRSEHWIVVHGTARVTCDEREFVIHENESTYIPIGSRHRLANPGKIPLDLIEVQVGSYLGEDDIVRFEDAYGRDKR
jgi:mannose-1-phosphate guanylyltransferase/mannose-6-phosphate isomerase